MDLSALEAAVVTAPQSVEPYLVYADALQERGDPHGELIALHHAGAPLPSALRRKVLHGKWGNNPKLHVKEWRLGFVEAAEVVFRKAPPQRVETYLQGLLEAGPMRLVSRLGLRFEEPRDGTYGALGRVMQALTRPLLSSLVIEGNDRESLSIKLLNDAFPRLRWLALTALVVRFDVPQMDHLEGLRIRVRSMAGRRTEEFFRCLFPKVTSLELRGSIEGRPLKNMPKLRALRLASPVAQFAAPTLLDDGVLARLETLALARLHTQDLQWALMEPARLRSLKKLQVLSPVSDTARTQLSVFGIEVEAPEE